MRRMQLASALFSRGAVRARWIRRLTLLSVVAVLAACQSYKDGQSRTVGEFTDDARIQAAVKTALIGDDDIKGMSVNVEVHRNVVSLYGRISSENARAKALKLAGDVRGVVRVEDRLTLIAPK